MHFSAVDPPCGKASFSDKTAQYLRYLQVQQMRDMNAFESRIDAPIDLDSRWCVQEPIDCR